MALTHAQTRRWTADEYMQLFEREVLSRDEKLELIDGHIVLMSSQNPPHKRGVARCTNALVTAYGETHYVVPAASLRLDPWSVPEPDFALVPRSLIDDSEEDFNSADLLVEVSDTSLAYDRREKASLYARDGILEYWIVQVRARKLLVLRDPRKMSRRPFGWDYKTVLTLGPEDVVQALMRPDVALRVADLV